MPGLDDVDTGGDFGVFRVGVCDEGEAVDCFLAGSAGGKFGGLEIIPVETFVAFWDIPKMPSAVSPEDLAAC